MTDDPTFERSAAARQSPSPRKERHWGNVAAGFSAACALAVSAYTAFLQRQQVKAQVWPILEWDTSTETGYDESTAMADGGGDAGKVETIPPSFRFNVRNSGVGPALMRAMEVSLDGQPIRTWDGLFEGPTSLPMTKGLYRVSESYLHGAVVAAGELKKVFEPESENATKALLHGFSRIHVRLCYCSVLNDCWELEAEGLKDEPDPEPVSTCFKPRVPFEQ